MDARESEKASGKHKVVETPRSPIVLAEKNNAATTTTTTTHRSRTREVSSRYKSPTPDRRFPSPNLTRTTPSSSSSSSQLLPKRAQSAERNKRPSTPPPSSPRPSTPIRDSSLDVKLSSRRAAASAAITAGGRLPDSLWPSTMRSLSVSFQSDSKPIASATDRTLRPVAASKVLQTPVQRKPTPERRRSPLKGKNGSDHQSENSKPVDSLPSRLIDQHRWPSRIGGRVSSSSALNRSVDLADTRISNILVPGTGFSSLRKLSSSGSGEGGKPLQRASSDVLSLLSVVGSGRIGSEVKAVDDCSLHVLRPQNDKAGLAISGVRSQTRSRPASPSKASMLRGVSPSRSRPATPNSRGVSPSRIRPISSSIQSSNSTSVLSFIADLKKGKKGASHIEDAHQLRLLYNRHLEWRFANARAKAVLDIQNAIVERTLYNVWNTTLSLLESVRRKRIDLQQLNHELKLNSILNDQLVTYLYNPDLLKWLKQMTCLDDWAVLETDHIEALSGAVEDLRTSTLRLPVTGGAKADIEHLKAAISRAVDIMRAMGSVICSLLLQVEGIKNLMSEVAVVAAKEKTTLDECEMLLASVAAMQVQESCLRTQLMQIKKALGISN